MNDYDQTLPKSAVEEVEGEILKASDVHRILSGKLDSLLWHTAFVSPEADAAKPGKVIAIRGQRGLYVPCSLISKHPREKGRNSSLGILVLNNPSYCHTTL